MFTINNMYEYTLEVNKSKFIGIIFKINSLEDFDKMLDSIKTKYPKATHYTYAYRLIDYYKMSDDGEPSSTAGAPIFNVIESNNLYNVGIVVVRYFGGIKLGAGGLVRAYSKTASNLIEDNRLNKLVEAVEIEITFNYDQSKVIDNLLNNCNCKIIDKDYKEDIIYHIIISKDDLDKLNKYNINIIKDTILEINA